MRIFGRKLNPEPKSSSSQDHSIEKVLTDEWAFIRRRRGLLANNSPPVRDATLVTSDQPKHLAGLALSGGGVRSATFCLGFIQALVERNLFERFDYLSTVSGGGYVGSTITTALAGETGKQRNPPVLPIRGEDGSIQEAEIVAHLRDYSRYLAPMRQSKPLLFPTLITLGFSINVLLLLPALIALALLVKSASMLSSLPHPVVIIAVVFSAWALLYALISSSTLPTGKTMSESQRWLHYTTYIFTGLAIFYFLSIQLSLVEMVTNVLSIKISDAWQWTLGSLSAFGVLFGLVGFIAGRLGRWVPFIWRIVLSLCAPIITWFVVLTVASTLVYPCAWAYFEDYTQLPLVSTLRPYLSQAQLPTFDYDQSCVLNAEPNSPERVIVQRSDLTIVVSFYVFSAILIFAIAMFVNVNSTSLHAFYRERLRDAYLHFPLKARSQRLSEQSENAPYHLINAAINIQNSTKNLRGRNAQPFLFSKMYTGSAITGWCSTTALEEADAQIDVAAATAISGAAIAPNQGVLTNRAARFLLALANARLGYWLINPHRINQGTSVGRKVSPYFFLRELFGRLDEKQSRVYVSDGGHIENLGLYELIRRRCSFIVAVDSEQDAKSHFHGFSHFIRIVKIDFGYDVEINLRDIRPDASGFSRKHAAFGNINYGDGTYGRILYVKASLNGNENEYISEYKSRFEDFPHQSTTDQFFTEEQFESYRALGHHVGLEVLSSDQSDLEALFDDLAQSLKLDVVESYAYLEVRDKITAMDRSVAENPESIRSKDAEFRLKTDIIEHAVLVLGLNEEHIANGPCRGIVDSLRLWIVAPEFTAYWHTSSPNTGNDCFRFISRTLARNLSA